MEPTDLDAGPEPAATDPYNLCESLFFNPPIASPDEPRGSGGHLLARTTPVGTYELAWVHAQDGKIAIDLESGTVIDINPAAEMLTGFSRNELIGVHVAMLGPENECERVLYELRENSDHPQRLLGFHLQRADGVCVPITISTSGARELDGRSVLLAGFRDITDQENRERQLAAQNWALAAFSHAASALSRAATAEELLKSICDAITTQSAYVLAFVSVAQDDPGKTVRFAAVAGSAASYLDGLRLSWAEDDPDGVGPSGVCIRTNRIHIVDDFEIDPSFTRWRDRTRQSGVRSVVGIPLSTVFGWRGALVVFSAESKAFDAEPVEVFQRLGEQIVHGIEALTHKQLLEAERCKLEEARKQLTDVLASTVAAMVRATEMRDPYTAGHESRVAEIAVAIGRELGWDEGKLLGMRLASMVHDVGKISIPAEILTKPGRLSQVEYELVKAHSEIGYAILKDVPFPWPVAEIVWQHHEKLDGSGYPQGLKGDQILIESRILGVADMVEAMASDRPYRRAHGLKFALQQVESEAGTTLDAEVVRICVALFREGRLIVPGLNGL